ncbi:MAG: di-heme oxidoredictase family protein [Gemmatimonadota bacterium]
MGQIVFVLSRGALGACLIAALAGCDTLFTGAPDDADLLDAPFPELTSEERAAFTRGDEAFGRAFTPADGLGPIFNDRSCAACHSGDGRGLPGNILVRIGVAPGFSREIGGPQIQTRAISGAVPEAIPSGVATSRRLPPPVFGVGLIEAIPIELIAAREDPDDLDGDGISGRASWIAPPDWVPTDEPGGGTGLQLGRFGRKAQVTNLLQQVVEAYHQDIGITTDFLPLENENPLSGAGTRSADRIPDPELPEGEVRAVVEYLRMLAPPAPGEMTPHRVEGAAHFEEVGCAACHVAELQTGNHRITALAYRPVPLYSDLLLHDMGEALADNRPDGAADGREWRTAPLWGLRVMRDFLAGEAYLLHDGRARSVEAAILFHGGEAASSRAAFEALNTEDRVALLDFVETR